MSDQTPVLVLIGVNFLFFICSFFIPSLIIKMALNLYYLPLEPWRIITSIFAHSDFWHIFSNMIALYFFGIFLIQLVGTGKFLLTYFIGGLVGNLIFLAFAYYGIFVNEYTAVIGASGAIYALGGVLVVLTPKLRVYLMGFIPMPLWVAVIGGFLIIFPGIAWQAHLGGLITGLVAGVIFRRQQQNRGIRYYIR